MKRHLFYTFLIIFVATSIVTLLGVVGVLHISSGHMTALLAAFLIELAGAVVALFRKTEFFAEDEHAKEMMALKKSYVDYTVELERKYRALVVRREQEDAYTPDQTWPGTATKNDRSDIRICHRCLLMDHIALPIIRDEVNNTWGCANCRNQLNKP